MRRGKYNVAPKEQRTWNGKTYDSKAECEYAQVLAAFVDAGEITSVDEQVRVTLGLDELVYIVDFLVTYPDGSKAYVDVKGFETEKFRRDKRLWKKYGHGTLQVVKRVSAGRFKIIETIVTEVRA